MNPYLESAVKRYEQQDNVFINPISEIDAQIISQVMIVLDKYDNKVLKAILDNYKYLKDNDIHDLIEEWNENNPIIANTEEDGSDNQFKRKFIDFESGTLEVWLVKSADKDDYYNFNKTRMEYRIVINKGFPENVAFADKTYSFSTPELRDEKLQVLKENIGKDIVML